MHDRRQQYRGRVYFGGRIAFNKRNSTFDCVVRNFSSTGVKIDLTAAPLLTEEIDLTIERKSLYFRARMVWRRDDEAGLVFCVHRPFKTEMTLDWALRFRTIEKQNETLTRRIDQMSSGY